MYLAFLAFQWFGFDPLVSIPSANRTTPAFASHAPRRESITPRESIRRLTPEQSRHSDRTTGSTRIIPATRAGSRCSNPLAISPPKECPTSTNGPSTPH